MKIIKHDGNFPVDEAIKADEPLIAAIAFDREKAIISQLDESVEHYILLQKVGISGAEIDKFFRIIFDKDGADWTFACPANYKSITDKTRRIAAFYKDGFSVISEFLAEINYFCEIKIPKRYRRHLESLE
jgi:hypothetical protein